MSRVVAQTSSVLGSGMTKALIVSVRQDVEDHIVASDDFGLCWR